MAALLNALLAIGAVTVALTATSLERRVALVLGATGSTVGAFLAWVVAPSAFSGFVPWVAAVLGTAALTAGWSVVRLYDGVFAPPPEPADETGTIATTAR
ncbi:hypothetical protein [Curtobacterium sp. 458]|uniref:hypothetical protein n=1 Tax=Curtobacterium sp. 458 TaxID=3050069 RepID=UPI0025B31BB2|nr:hypothetical protein [Curtobacterium sp. 458]WJY00993.1 hypothetical protein QPJ90_04665 [Curtobacterium sp. 458]